MSCARLSSNDPGSYSNPQDAVVQHIDLDFEVDFTKKIIVGSVTLTVFTYAKASQQLVLDTRDLNIKRVVDCEGDKGIAYEVSDPIHTFGSRLTVSLPHNEDCNKYLIRVDYETSPKSTALQWLTPEQTAGKKHPYLFSQCEPDHCRSMIPCQDTPVVKATYNASVTVPEEFTVLMSAIKQNEPTKLPGGKKKYCFSQQVPIPSYLIALAVGNLQSRKLGPRTSVWAEPEVVEKAEYEFKETDVLLKTAEDICGPYVWKIYDLLVMPPSFPYGGMENPCLTFVTPTLLSGDRSLVNVVSHEISHSWSGNLVSMKNFEHFWLNEGFTTFIERKINGRTRGEKYRHFTAIGGLQDLSRSVNFLGENNPFTKLVTDLTGVDPDEAFSTCPYEKGHTFLFYLEGLVGGASVFDPFLRSYFSKFKYQSLDTNEFKNYLYSYFPDNEALKSVDWDMWFNTTGMPPIIPEYDRSMEESCVNLANRWLSEDKVQDDADFKALIPEQKEVFLARLLEQNTPLPIDKVKHMNELYQMNSIQNAEIRFRWLRLCVQSKWEEQVPVVLQFITEQGRMKYCRPLYKDLFAWSYSREAAVQSLEINKSCMMYVLSHNLENDLQNTPVAD